MAQCGIVTTRQDITQSDHAKECLRPARHLGPHLIFTRHGYVVWRNELCPPGTCEDCESEDPADWCGTYWEVSDQEARRLLYSDDRGEKENP